MDEASFNARFFAALEDWEIPNVEGLARHAWLVREKNRVMNLTRITDPEGMALRHALDAIAAVPLLNGDAGPVIHRVLDIGTGAGWPGLALAIVCPHLEVTLLDARRKKIDFLQEAIADLGLQDRVTAVWSRFEDYIQAEQDSFDVVMARAVGPIDRLLEWCTNRWFGPLLLWKGPALEDELKAARQLMRKRRLEVTLDLDYMLPGDETPYRIVMLDRDE